MHFSQILTSYIVAFLFGLLFHSTSMLSENIVCPCAVKEYRMCNALYPTMRVRRMLKTICQTQWFK